MPTSVELRQERARVVESMRATTETAESENRDLSAEERESYDRHEADFTSLTSRIERQEALEARELEQGRSLHPEGDGDGGGNRGGTGAPAGAPDGPEQRAAQQRSAFAAFIRRGQARLAPEQRALVENDDGQIIVPEELEAEIIRALPDLTVMRGLVSTRTIGTNRVRRRSLDEVSVGWGKLETSEQTLKDSMPSKPDEEYTYVEDLYGLAKIGEDEFDDTDVNLEGFVRDSFSQALGEAEDTGAAVGTGHSNHQPVGLFTSGGGVDSITSGAAGKVSIDDFKSLIYAVPAQYRRNGSFLMASSTELALSLVKDGNDQYLWQPSNQAGRPNTFLGYALNNQEDVAAVAAGKTVAAFGDYNRAYRLYDRLGMTVQRLVELYSEDGYIGFKVRRRVTGDVIRPDAARLLKVKSSG
jgi:HK97 family phage major capsid protein